MNCINSIEHKKLIELVKLGKLFEIVEWVESGKTTLIPDNSKKWHSLIYQAIQRGNHSMIVYLLRNADLLSWEKENLIRWAGELGKDLRAAIIRLFLDEGVELGNATASDIFFTFDDSVIDKALKRGLSLRGYNGFADCLIDTNVARPLLRYFRAYRNQYPDLEVEAIIAGKWFVREKRKRACALLGWVGIDTNRVINDASPYEPAVQDHHKRILDEIRLDADTEEILKLLKIKITAEIWWHFFIETMWLYPKHIKKVLDWVDNPEQLIQSDPLKAEEALDFSLKLFAPKDSYLSVHNEPFELDLLKVAQHLVLLGTKCIQGDPKSYRDYRCPMYASEHEEEVAKLCWLIYECGDDAQKQRVYHLVKIPQLKKLVKRHEQEFIKFLYTSAKPEEVKDYQKHSQKRISEMDVNYFKSLKSK